MTPVLAVAATGLASASLVDRAAGGDRVAFDRLAAGAVDDLLRVATAILRSEADAADVVQDTLVAAWRDLPRLRDRGCFDAWLTRILVNRARSLLRHRRRITLREVAFDPPEVPGRAPGAVPRELRSAPAQDRVPEADAIRRAFERLDPDARILLVLHHLEGRSVADLAAIHGMPEGTVKWRLHEARNRLERILEEDR